MSPKKSRWDREKIAAEIKQLGDKGARLTVKNVSRKHSALYSAALRYYKSWGDAVKAAAIDYDAIKKESRREAVKKITKWNRARVLEEIKGVPVAKLWYIYKNNVALHSAARREFGSWRKALEAAGYDYDDVNRAAGTRYTSWTREKIIKMIRELPPDRLSYGNMTKENLLLYSAAYRRFGNWQNALRAAGLPEDLIKKSFKNRKWTPERIIDEIKKRHGTGGKLASGYMQRHDPSLFSAAFRRFGSWGEAIIAAGLDYRTILRNKAHTR
jgi:lambda repressor-like predicted transcriptional regulator